MNKYEALFDEILKQTQARALEWRQLRRSANADLIFNPTLVYRQFSTEMQRRGHSFTLLLVEKKYDDPEHDFAYQRYAPELLVVDDDGELVTTLTDSVIEWRDLMRLASMVEAQSDKVSKLFDAS